MLSGRSLVARLATCRLLSVTSPQRVQGGPDDTEAARYGYKIDGGFTSGTPATMFSLPYQQHSQGLDICFVGVPFDGGCVGMPGARLGPRTIRHLSAWRKHYNYCTGAAPYDKLNVADCGDVDLLVEQFSNKRAVQKIKETFESLISTGCKTIAMGGDHTITHPILQAIKEKYGPVGLIHVDAHDDSEPCGIMGLDVPYQGHVIHPSTEEGCLDPSRVIQIGLRAGAGWDPEDWSYARLKGFRIVQAREYWHRSMAPLMDEVRSMMGGHPVYLTVDIDVLDLPFVPGTGVPEAGGLTPIQLIEIIQGCAGLNLVGCDLVEVSPPLDVGNITTALASQLLFEMLCVFPGVHNKGLP